MQVFGREEKVNHFFNCTVEKDGGKIKKDVCFRNEEMRGNNFFRWRK